MRWFEELPLFGQRIVVTRPIDEADRSAAALEALGAEVLVAPTVEVRPIDDPARSTARSRRLDAFDWLVFTSGNGVRCFLDRLESLGPRPPRAWGSSSSRRSVPRRPRPWRHYHLRADLVPDSFRSEALAQALAPHVAGRRVLLARADRGRTLLLDELRSIAHVEQIAVYRNADAEALPPAVARAARRRLGRLDHPDQLGDHRAAPRALARGGPPRIGREIRLASLSPVTSATAARLGWPIAAEASVYTWPGWFRPSLTASPARGRPGSERDTR